MEADALSRAPFIRPSFDARQNRAALMYDEAVPATSTEGNPSIHFLTIAEALDTDSFFQAATRVARGEIPRNWAADDPHALHLPNLHRLADRLYKHHGRLRLRGTLGNEDVIVIPNSATSALLNEFHQHHAGIPKMLQALQQRYFWPSLKDDVTTLVRNCSACNRGKRGPDARQELHPLPITRPGERYHLDRIVMGSPSARGHTSILVLRDAGSRFSWFAPMHDSTALAAAKQLHHWFCINGVPRQLTSDDEFTTTLLDEICAQLHILRHTVTPYYHAGNEVVERVIDQAHQLRFRYLPATLFGRRNKDLWASDRDRNAALDAYTWWSDDQML